MRSLFPRMQPRANSNAEISSVESRSLLSLKSCVLFLISCWLLNIAVLIVLQLCHTSFGLKVWPMGEDRVWISLLQNNHGFDVARAFWHLNDRNPLSPWWYMAFSPIIMSFEFGIYAVRKIVDPLLATSAFLLFDTISGGRRRAFCLATATIILFWNFSYNYIEQIMWNFLMALTCNLIAIWCYQKFLESKRQKSVYQAASLVVYFLAFTSYTLQCGAVGANFVLALTQRTGESVRVKLKNACIDAVPFVMLFALYTLIWTTTSKPVVDYYQMHVERIKDQFFASVGNFLWQTDYSSLVESMSKEWSPVVLYGSYIFLSIAAYFLFDKIFKAEDAEASQFKDGDGDVAIESKITAPTTRVFLINFLAVILAVALPTILVESTSHLWLPGTRVRMIGQFTSPCLFALLVLATAEICKSFKRLNQFKYGFSPRTFALSFSLLLSAAVLMGFQYNKMLVTQTAFERRLAQGLRWYLLPGTAHRYFVVRLDNTKWAISQYLLDTFVETAFNMGNLHLRIVPDYLPTPLENHPHWFITVSDKGVKHAAIDFGHGFIPWNQVIFLSFDGQKIHLIDPVKESDFKGLQMKWLTKLSIHQSLTPETFAIAEKALQKSEAKSKPAAPVPVVDEDEARDLPNPTDPN